MSIGIDFWLQLIVLLACLFYAAPRGGMTLGLMGGIGLIITGYCIADEAIEEAEIQIKYKGYIEREKFIAEKLHRLENIRIPDDFDFFSLQALTIEARQKLTRIRPQTIGQASRIPGVSPADVNVLLVRFGR